MSKRNLRDMEPVVPTPAASKKRKVQHSVQDMGPKVQTVPEPVAVKKSKASMRKPVNTKKRSLRDVDECPIPKVSSATKKRRISVEDGVTMLSGDSAPESETKDWDVKAIIGRIINPYYSSLFPTYLYELENLPVEHAQWSWNKHTGFKHPSKVEKLQVQFDRIHLKGTQGLKVGTIECVQACQKHAVLPPSGAPAKALKDSEGNLRAWFGSGGLTDTEEAAKSPATGTNEVVQGVVPGPLKAPVKKGRFSPARFWTYEEIEDETREKEEAVRVETQGDTFSRTLRPSRRHSEEKNKSSSPTNPPALHGASKPAAKKKTSPVPVPPKFTPNSVALHRVPLHLHPCTQKEIVGLYSRHLNTSSTSGTDANRSADATYTPIFTRDSQNQILRMQVPWYENPSAQLQFYLMEWTGLSGGRIQGLVPVEDAVEHVKSYSYIEAFEHEVWEARIKNGTAREYAEKSAKNIEN